MAVILKKNKIKLEGGAEVFVSAYAPMNHCKACNALILWTETANGKKMPVTKKGGKYYSHFSDCPAANKFRK
jgi:hypothetical protein